MKANSRIKFQWFIFAICATCIRVSEAQGQAIVDVQSTPVVSGSVPIDREWIEQQAHTSVFRFRVKAMSNDGDHFAVSAIEISNNTGKRVQLISNVGGQPVTAKADRLLQVIDVNFDGHEDIAVPTSDGGAGPNTTSNFYLFEPRQKKFKLDRELSSLPQVSINPDQTITSVYRDGCCSHGTKTFRYLTGRLMLVSSRDESLSSDGQTVETTVGNLVGGKIHYTVTREKAPEDN